MRTRVVLRDSPRSAVEKAGELASEIRPGISLNRSRPRLDGECEREAAHGIERDAESPCPLGARNVLRRCVGGDRGEHGGLGPLQRGKRGVELGIVGGSDPHLDPHGVQVVGERGPEHVEQSRRTARTADGRRVRGPSPQVGLHSTPDLVERRRDEINPGREMMCNRPERRSSGLRDLPGRRGRIPVIGNGSDGRLDQSGAGLIAPRLLRPRSAAANRSRCHKNTI
jgi:hypothetical protein